MRTNIRPVLLRQGEPGTPKYTHSRFHFRYDKILLSPGVYDEQIAISSKIPFEIVGEGDLGQVRR